MEEMWPTDRGYYLMTEIWAKSERLSGHWGRQITGRNDTDDAPCFFAAVFFIFLFFTPRLCEILRVGCVRLWM